MDIFYFSSRQQRSVGFVGSFAKRERESRVRQEEVEQTCEEGDEDEGDEEKDTGSVRRKNGAGVILQREADV